MFFLGKVNLWHFQIVQLQITCSYFSTERHCSTFQKPKGVIVSPSSCGKQPAKPGTVCQLSCRQGFLLSGAREMRCTTAGKWNAKVQTAVCKGRAVYPPVACCYYKILELKCFSKKKRPVCYAVLEAPGHDTDVYTHW